MRTYKENGCDCQNCYYQAFENNNFQRPICYKEHEIYSNGSAHDFSWENSRVWRMNRNEDYSLTIADDCEDYIHYLDGQLRKIYLGE
ncbi:hypothetical protein [Brachyspira sp.]|uniref:hypothetical protein n=1 Tax=Brachyspira sp. TaxID=1977261 RepID=UPI003D7CBA36